MEVNTPRNFVLQLGALLSLYISLSALLVLLFGIINLSIPDATDSIWDIEGSQSSIRFSIAALIVFFPTFLILQRRVNQIRRHESTQRYLTITKWLIYLSLLVGGGVLLGDLVSVIMTFLEGEVTLRFILKALSVLIVVGAALYYYVQDVRSYWLQHERHSVYCSLAAIVVVFTSLIYGVSVIETPTEVREGKLDEQQINDLRNIQQHIIEYIRRNGTTPTSTATTYRSGITPPTAPEGRVAYEYAKTDRGFELCAEFAQTSQKTDYLGRPAPSLADKELLVENQENWEHGTGRVCFERIVNLDVVE